MDPWTTLMHTGLLAIMRIIAVYTRFMHSSIQHDPHQSLLLTQFPRHSNTHPFLRDYPGETVQER